MNLDRFHIHIPDNMFVKYAEKALSEKINVDFYPKMGFIEQVGMDELVRIRDKFYRNNLRFSVHAPFIDISPGSPDPKIADVAKYRIFRALQLAHFLKAKVMVSHAGSEVLKYGFVYDGFIKNSVKFWSEIKYIAEDLDVKIAIENTIEKKPDLQCEIIKSVNSPYIGYCFDIGHWNLESKLPIMDWLNAFGDKLFATHVHDNMGDGDSHLALGEGNIDFKPLIDFVERRNLQTVFIVENHDEESVLKSLRVIRSVEFG
ncbi:sugar phosphate isomerase/epimerase [bacterium]|nr:sugar phosphate isomerase/epimerase [bacterium]